MGLTQDAWDDIRLADQKGRITLGSRYAGKRFAMREEPDGTAVLTPVRIVPEIAAASVSESVEQSLAVLATLTDDWDGRGSSAPSAAALASAREVIAMLQAGLRARQQRWTDPHVGANERGEIVLEWWRDDRTLTLFIRDGDRVDYLKTWGADIVSEMEDGEVARVADLVALNNWLDRGGRSSG